MKTRFQKLTSLILVLVMLLTMIPAGMFVATAEVSAELAAALADYDNSAEFVINNVDDWNAIAASGKTFSGKTVKLGANIDAQGATLPPLAPFEVNNSGLILDGQGFAVKNVGTADAPQTRPLVSEKFSGGTVKNITFQNVVMVGADATYGSGLIADWLNGWGTATVQNVKVLGCNISDTVGCAGALFGRTINNNSAASVVIDGVVMDSATNVTAPAGHAGGLIGHISGNGGTYTLSRIYTEANVKTDNPANKYVGGLVGYANGSNAEIQVDGVGTGEYYTSQFNVTDCVVKGTITSTGASSWTGRIGGIFGRGSTLVDFNIADTIIAPSAVVISGAVVLNQTICASNGKQDVSVSDCYQVSRKFTSVYFGENTATTTYDGVASSDQHQYTLPGMTTIDATAVDNYYETDDNGFVVSVHEEQVAPPPAAPEGVSEELEAALADYENCAEFVINNVDDWNYFAEFTAKNNKYEWEGKTVKLGANIDAQGATLPTLFAAHNTRALFDGQGYSIKNVGTVASPNTAALFSADTGNVGFKGDIQNLTLNNVIVSGSGSAKALLVEWVNADTETAFKNIKVLNCSVTNASGPAAAIAGKTSATGNSFGVLFENILVSGSQITGASVLKLNDKGEYITGGWNATGTAALCGYFTWSSGDTGATARNIEVVNTTITDATPLPEGATVAPAHVAGLFGYYRMNAGVGLTIENVYVNATLQTPNAGGWTGVAAGLFRTDNSSTGNTITIKNAITNNALPGIVQNPTIAYVTQGTFILENLYTVENRTDKTVWAVNGGNVINGVASESNYNAFQPTFVSADSIVTMLTKSEDGFITAIVAPTTPEVPGPGEGGSGTTPDPEPTEELVIDSVAKWNEIAASDTDYSNYKILLGADLDFEGAAISPLFKVAFGGIFDGQGYTIKNAVVNGEGTLALIAPEAGNGACFRNVKFDNITVNSTGKDLTHVGLLAGVLVSVKDVTIEKIIASNITINHAGSGAAGGLIGWWQLGDAAASNGCIATMQNVIFSGTVTSATNNTNANNGYPLGAGGLVGSVAFNHTGSGDPCKLYVKAIEATVTVTGTKVADQYIGIGGLIGSTSNISNAHWYEISNCYVNATVDATGTGSLGGLVGYTFTGPNKINNCIVNTVKGENGATYASILGTFRNGVKITASNLYTTIGTSLKHLQGITDTDEINGVLMSSNPNVINALPVSLLDSILVYDEDGYISEFKALEADDSQIPNYDTSDEFIINSIEDWMRISNSKLDFSGKTIKLGANIDAKGASLPYLIFALDATNVIFDGCGYTIKNVGTADLPSTYALIAYKLGAATIKNVTFENIHVSGSGAMGLISGSMILPENGTALIENIKVLGCTVTGGAATGSLLGTVNDTDANCTLTIRSVTIDENTKVTGGATTGGLVGEVANVGTLNIFNVYTKATVTGLSDDHYVGGLVGETNSTGNGIINIINFYNGGNLVSTNNAEKVNSAGVGGVVGRFTGYAGKTIVGPDGSISYETAKTVTLKNILLDCQFLETNKRATAWIGTMQGQGYLYYDNIMTTNSTGSNRPKPQWKLIAVNSNTMINGKPMNGEIPSPSAGDLDDLLFVEAKIARTLAVVDEETGFLKSINALVEAYTYQYSEVIDGKFSIRFVGTSQLITEETILMHVKATTASGVVRNFTVQSPGMEKLFPFDDHNISESIVAADIGVQKMLSVTVFDIPVGEAITFEFWVTMAMPSGAVVTSTQTLTVTFDATGAPVVAA